MPKALVTGGAGFFGGVLKQRLLADGYDVVSFDRVPDTTSHPRLKSILGDLRDRELVDATMREGGFDAVFHCAAALAHGMHVDTKDIWTSNVDATRLLAEAAQRHGAPKFVFISTNCLWARNLGHPVREDEPPQPVEIYGESKMAAEKVLREFEGSLDVTMIRCPTIIDSGRLGLLAILFEFIHENKTVWVVGDGGNHYQFIYAEDLAEACVLGLNAKGVNLFHVGSDHVPTLRETYEAVIREAGSRSKVKSLPKGPTLAAMRLAHLLHVSPLGPYHYRMIAEDFVFDTTQIKERLGWRPTLTNSEMLERAYRYYAERRNEIHARENVSAHSKPASMGLIRVLKWFS
jgi:nucleoside-diphosphate-sugar epimerase